MKLDTEALSIIAGFGLLFGLMGFAGDTSWNGFLAGGGFGSFIGFAALPYFDSKKWPKRPLICALIACGATIALAVSREQSLTAIATLGTVGFVFGYLSPYFAKYL